MAAAAKEREDGLSASSGVLIRVYCEPEPVRR